MLWCREAKFGFGVWVMGGSCRVFCIIFACCDMVIYGVCGLGRELKKL
jgi:hypothetical protein